jgi:hypothetical protein
LKNMMWGRLLLALLDIGPNTIMTLGARFHIEWCRNNEGDSHEKERSFLRPSAQFYKWPSGLLLLESRMISLGCCCADSDVLLPRFSLLYVAAGPPARSGYFPCCWVPRTRRIPLSVSPTMK